jgi:hypothetical protein
MARIAVDDVAVVQLLELLFGNLFQGGELVTGLDDPPAGRRRRTTR